MVRHLFHILKKSKESGIKATGFDPEQTPVKGEGADAPSKDSASINAQLASSCSGNACGLDRHSRWSVAYGLTHIVGSS